MKLWAWGRVLSNAAVGLAIGSVSLIACDGDEDAFNGIQSGPDAQPVETEAGADAHEGDASASPDADAGEFGCVPGRAVSATVTPSGASLSLCGATLEIPGAVLPAGNKVGIEIVEQQGTPWFEHEFSGPTFHFTPDDVIFSRPAKIALRRDMTKQRGPILARWLPPDNQWGEHEACPKDDMLSLDTVALGTFALQQDINVYPDGPSGLGTGTITLNLLGNETTWTVPNEGGYSVYEGSATDRTMILVAQRYEQTVLQNLDIRFLTRAGQAPVLLGVDYISTDDTSGSWNFLEPVHGPPTSFTATENAGTYQAEIHVTAHKGDETTPLDATFTTTPIKFRPPPSYSCGAPEGDHR